MSGFVLLACLLCWENSTALESLESVMGKQVKKHSFLVRDGPAVPVLLKHYLVFHNSRLTQRWALECSMDTVGVHAMPGPNVPPVPDNVGVGPVNHTEHFNRAHVLTHSTYTASAHINTLASAV